MKKFNAFVITLTLFGFLLLIGSEVQAQKPCMRANGNGQTVAVGPNTFQGTAVVTIDDQVENADVTTVILGPPRMTEDGTLHAATSHTMVFSGGNSLITLDKAVLSPTDTPGVYNLNTRAGIVGGTGDFEGAEGFLSIHGTINLISGTASWRFNGRLCD